MAIDLSEINIPIHLLEVWWRPGIGSFARIPLCQMRSKALEISREVILLSPKGILSRRPKINSISDKIIRRSGILKYTLVIKKDIVCFKEGNGFFNDGGLHFFRDHLSDCNGMIIEKIRFITYFWEGEDVG